MKEIHPAAKTVEDEESRLGDGVFDVRFFVPLFENGNLLWFLTHEKEESRILTFQLKQGFIGLFKMG